MPPATVFDTDYVLCSSMVHSVLGHERDDTLHVPGAWSREGLALAAQRGLTRADLQQTLLSVAEGRALTRSDAAFGIALRLRAPDRWLRPARFVVPRP